MWRKKVKNKGKLNVPGLPLKENALKFFLTCDSSPWPVSPFWVKFQYNLFFSYLSLSSAKQDGENSEDHKVERYIKRGGKFGAQFLNEERCFKNI